MLGKVFDWFVGNDRKPSTLLGSELQSHVDQMTNIAAKELNHKFKTASDYLWLANNMMMMAAEDNRVDTYVTVMNAAALYYIGRDYERAIKSWQLVIDHCDDIVDEARNMAEYCLGRVYFDGEVVERDRSKAMEYWTSSAMAGHLNAQMWLGILYAEIHMYQISAYWLSIAKERGFESAGVQLKTLVNFVAGDPQQKRDVKEGIKEGKDTAKIYKKQGR
ncbi:MAG: sel1 repeat family protein [Synergistaceae bacterium]|nr:sel1 repeat family protein [Synergistaceae bacterium]